MAKANRKYKDSVLVNFFSESPEKLVELYNAIEGTNYPKDTKIEIKNLKDALYKDRINDLSFVIDGQMVVLVEHQSTINNNMALRMLLYMGRVYESILPTDMIYRSERIGIPAPKFFVLYNGKKKQPQHSVQRLSDAFINKQNNPMLDLVVDVWNINYGEADERIFANCQSLKEYSLFIHCVREKIAQGIDINEAVSQAVKDCIQNNVMREFLSEHGSEVENMLFTDWNWDTAIEVAKEEALEKGMEKGVIKSLCDLVYKGLLSLKDALNESSLSEPDFMSWMHQFHPDYRAQ